MKLLVFAHVPPPHHGQSYMVKLMLDGFGGDHRKRSNRHATTPHDIECYHVNVRLSKQLEDIGNMRFGKFFLLLVYCLQAIVCRFRYGIDNFYYVPTPGKKSALYRDWLVMLLCRPFFKRIIFHWHAAGLAKWLETCTQIRSRSFTYSLMKDVDLSIVLSSYNRADAEKLFPKKIEIISNGIPDPCPDFERNISSRRKARREARESIMAGKNPSPETTRHAGSDPHLFKVLFLGHCTRQKGLFDTLDGIAAANQRMAESGSAMRVHLTVAGTFLSVQERNEFDERIQQLNLASAVSYIGFVAGADKTRVFLESDCFCFPTFYYAESFGLVVIEAMAFGIPAVTTRWRSLPEILPAGYPGLIDVGSSKQIADALLNSMTEDGAALRNLFFKHYTLNSYLENLAQAFHSIEQNNVRQVPVPIPTA